MRVAATLRARDPRTAAAATTVMLVVAGVILVPWTLATPDVGPGARDVCLVMAGALLVGGGVLRLLDAATVDGCGALFATHVIGAALIPVANVLTADASAAAQIFAMLPVLLTGSQMRGGAASVVATIGVLGNGITAAAVGVEQGGWFDFVVIGVAQVAMSTMLVRAGDMNEASVRALADRVATDELTGLLRRDAIAERLRQSLSQQETALLLIDVDDFKKINDTHGHAAGDEALQHLANVLRSQLRRSDCVAGRLGGDELVMVLPGCPAEALEKRARDVVAAVRATPLLLSDGTEVPITISVGGAHCGSFATTPADLRAFADHALYRAKASGRNTHVIAHPTVVGAVDHDQGADSAESKQPSPG